jgi:hypothetical protein
MHNLKILQVLMPWVHTDKIVRQRAAVYHRTYLTLLFVEHWLADLEGTHALHVYTLSYMTPPSRAV